MREIKLKAVTKNHSFLAVSDLAERAAAGEVTVNTEGADKQDIALFRAYVRYYKSCGRTTTLF